jgi:hypothetical protein
MKDKTRLKVSQTVLHKPDEGQNETPSKPKLSFISRIKDKTRLKVSQTVLHKADEGQNGTPGKPNCPSLAG